MHVPKIDTHSKVGDDKVAAEEDNAADKRAMQNIAHFKAGGD